MWRISYLDVSNDDVKQKGGFVNDKEAIEWAEQHERDNSIVALTLLVWSEYLQSYRTVLNLQKH